MPLYQPSGLFRGIPCPGTGYFALGGKVTKTPPGTPRTPFFVQSVGIGFGTGQPLKYLFASGFFVIGAVRHALRLSALESMVVSFFTDESLCSSRKSRQLITEKQMNLSL